MSTPSISVLVAVYNTEDYLEQCLSSITAQSFSDFEVICIDDGSTDGSLAILNNYAANDSRFIVIHQENHGVGYTKNLALSKATGKYVVVIDSDDFIEPDTFETVYYRAEQTDADIVGFPYGFYYEQTNEFVPNKVTVNELYLPQSEVFSALDIPETIFQVFTPEVWNKLWLRSFLNANQLHFGQFTYAEDYYLMYWAMAIAKRISACSGKSYYHYRKGRVGSLTADDTNPLVFIEPYNSLKTKLLELGIFKTIEHSYANLTLSGIVYEYTRHQNEKVRATLAEYLKNKGFEELGLTEVSASYYYDKSHYDLFMAIKNSSPEVANKLASDSQHSLPVRFFRFLRAHGVRATARRILRGRLD